MLRSGRVKVSPHAPHSHQCVHLPMSTNEQCQSRQNQRRVASICPNRVTQAHSPCQGHSPASRPLMPHTVGTTGVPPTTVAQPQWTPPLFLILMAKGPSFRVSDVILLSSPFGTSFLLCLLNLPITMTSQFLCCALHFLRSLVIRSPLSLCGC